MSQQYTSLGLMSGTSGDGVDASIIQSNGETKYDVIKDKYYEYDNEIYQDIHKLKEKIQNSKDIEALDTELKNLERKLPYFMQKLLKKLKKADK